MPSGVYERTHFPPLEERFWAKVDKSGDCWLWTAALNKGYGAFGVGGGRVMLAHRFAYSIVRGPIPDGLTLDHLCRVRSCVNPDHLEVVTLAENIRRGYSPTIVLNRSARCARGHEWTPENTYEPPGGGRQCVACRIIRAREPAYLAKQAARARARRAARKGLASADR